MHTPTKAILGTLCLVLGSSPMAAAQSFSYPDFTNWTGISPVGMTIQNGAILQLQDNVAPAFGGDNRGAAWYDTAVNVVGGFDTTFVYHMHTVSTTGGSDGMAFVIQNDQIAGSVPIVNGYPDGTGNTAIGRHASAAGFGAFLNPVTGDSVDNSIAIHFDTYMNGSPWGDLDSNHISVHTGGNADNSQDEAYSLGRVSPTTNLNDGLQHTVRVLYVPGTLEIYFDGNLELTVPYDFNTGGVWVDSGTPVGGLDLIGGSSAYVGFTSGAGPAREYRAINSWAFASGPCSPVVYCTYTDATTATACGFAQCPSSGGCSAMITTSSPSACPVSGANDYDVVVNGAENDKPGIVFYGYGQAAIAPFSSGTLCIKPPLKRSWPAATGSAGSACTGSLTLRINNPAGVDHPTGTVVQFQGWMRDPMSAPATDLSDAVEVTYQ